MLKVIEEGTWTDGGKGMIVLESDHADPSMAIQELRSGDVQRTAIAEAAKRGLGTPGCGFGSGPYPVGVDGKPLDYESGTKAAAYRVEIEVNARL